jgi:hypothetical protein
VDKDVDDLWETGSSGGKIDARSVPHMREIPGRSVSFPLCPSDKGLVKLSSVLRIPYFTYTTEVIVHIPLFQNRWPK